MLLALLAAPAWATDVLVPAPAPGSVADFSVAYMFGGLVVSALEDQRVDVDDDDAIHRWAGGDAADCYETAACPQNLWDRTDARLAVVIAVATTPSGLHVQVRLIPADGRPETAMQADVPGGGEVAYANQIRDAVTALLPDLPPRPAPERHTPPPVPAPHVVVEAEHPAAVPAPPKQPHTLEEYQADRASRKEQADLGLPWPVYVRYRESGQKWRDWSKANRVRAQKLWIGAWGGVSYGDIDRGYDDREQIAALAGGTFDQTGYASVDSAVVGLGPTFGGEAGYSPAWWGEIDVMVGAQSGQKYLTTGWECTAGCAEPDYELVYDPKPAFTLWIEPRFKGVFVPTGIVKPYVLVGATFLAGDGYEIPEGSLTYHNADGTFEFGPTAGLGLGFDLTPDVTIQLEVPYTYFLLGTQNVAGDATLFATPPGDYGGPLPGVIRGTLSLGARL